MLSPFAARLTKLQVSLTPEQALLLTDTSDIAYFSGFISLVPEEREGFLLITRSQSYLLHASFSPVPTSDLFTLLPGTTPQQLTKHVQKILAETQSKELLIDKTKLYANEYDAIWQLSQYSIQNFDRALVEQLRMVKDAGEISLIQAAGDIAIRAFAALQPQIRLGMTERQVQQGLELEMLKAGSEKPAFPTIVAFNEHGALPHHQPTDTPLKENSAVLIDFGATYRQYRSDVTRTFWFGGQPSASFVKIEQIVKQAYFEALAVLSDKKNPLSHTSHISHAKDPNDQKAAPEPLTAAAVDNAARSYITQAGYAREFIHTTGHGVGLDIHEQPSLNWANETVLLPGTVITIEPGIYLADQFGYRHEDTVVVTKKGYDILTEEKTLP